MKSTIVGMLVAIFVIGTFSLPAGAQPKGKYTVTISYTEKWTTYTAGTLIAQKVSKRRHDYVVAFVGGQTLVSADTVADEVNSFLGSKFSGSGRKCSKSGTTSYCIIYGERQDGADVKLAIDLRNLKNINVTFRIVTTAKGCSVSGVSYKQAGYGVGDPWRFVMSNMKSSCRRG